MEVKYGGDLTKGISSEKFITVLYYYYFTLTHII